MGGMILGTLSGYARLRPGREFLAYLWIGIVGFVMFSAVAADTEMFGVEGLAAEDPCRLNRREFCAAPTAIIIHTTDDCRRCGDRLQGRPRMTGLPADT
jgi:hypothetical protein